MRRSNTCRKASYGDIVPNGTSLRLKDPGLMPMIAGPSSCSSRGAAAISERELEADVCRGMKQARPPNGLEANLDLSKSASRSDKLDLGFKVRNRPSGKGVMGCVQFSEPT